MDKSILYFKVLASNSVLLFVFINELSKLTSEHQII